MTDTNNGNHIVFTVCNLKYLDKALVLGKSLYETNSIILKIYIFDRKIDLSHLPDYVSITWVEEIADDNFYVNAFKYDVIELTTAYKPFIAMHLAKRYPTNNILFFDPDIMIFQSLEEITNKLNNHDFVLTPHISEIQYNPNENIHLQRFGFFNLGFFAFTPTENSINILNWWWTQCSELAFNEVHSGMFTDQKWMSLVPFYFNKILILRDKNLNVAWWNLKERQIQIHEGSFYIENEPLIFYHFSAFGSNSKITKRDFDMGDNSDHILNNLANAYAINLSEFSFLKKIIRSYSFDYFNDGSYINPVLRRAYASSCSLTTNKINPFEKGVEIRGFMRKNYLNSRNDKNFSFISHGDRSKYDIYFRSYTWCLRMLLMLFGPNRFMALNRMITFSSSLIFYKDFWKK